MDNFMGYGKPAVHDTQQIPGIVLCKTLTSRFNQASHRQRGCGNESENLTTGFMASLSVKENLGIKLRENFCQQVSLSARRNEPFLENVLNCFRLATLAIMISPVVNDQLIQNSLLFSGSDLSNTLSQDQLYQKGTLFVVALRVGDSPIRYKMSILVCLHKCLWGIIEASSNGSTPVVLLYYYFVT